MKRSRALVLVLLGGLAACAAGCDGGFFGILPVIGIWKYEITYPAVPVVVIPNPLTVSQAEFEPLIQGMLSN